MRSKPTGPVATTAPETRRSARTASSTSSASRGGRSPGCSSSVTESAQRRSGSPPKPGGTSRLASGQLAAMSPHVRAHERDAAAEVGGRLADEHAHERRERVVEVAAAGDAAVERPEDGVEGLLRALEAVLALGDLDRERPQHGRPQRLAIVDGVADVQARVLDGARRRLEQRERAASRRPGPGSARGARRGRRRRAGGSCRARPRAPRARRARTAPRPRWRGRARPARTRPARSAGAALAAPRRARRRAERERCSCRRGSPSHRPFLPPCTIRGQAPHSAEVRSARYGVRPCTLGVRPRACTAERSRWRLARPAHSP